MSVIVVDTSVLIDQLRGNIDARLAMAKAAGAGHRVAASVLTKTELLAGMRSHERSAIRRLVSILTWVPVSDEVAERAGRYARVYRASHATIDVVDYVIAATAYELEADLWTRNVRHFPMVPHLAPPY
jgi:hypothetical protein